MDYFPHDTKAMSDDKLLALRITKGLDAVACYWAIIEKIYADEQPFEVSETNVEATSVLLRLGVGFDTLSDYVFHMVEIGLLESDVDNPKLVTSKRAMEQIETLNKKRETARQNGKSGGRKPKGGKRGNQSKTNVGSNGEPKSAAYKTLNVIGSHKENQITEASDDAAAGKPAPPSALQCPKCGSGMIGTGSHRGGSRLFLCPDCAEEVWA